MKKDLCITIAGEAGQGINVSALFLARAFIRRGLYAFLLTENPNSIKLEHAWCSIRVSQEMIYAQSHEVDILVALDRDSILKHSRELSSGGILVWDGEGIPLEEKDKRADIRYCSVPFESLIKTLGVSPLQRNIVAMGAVLALVGDELSLIKEIIQEQFSRKGNDVVAHNNAALEAGFSHVSKTCQICLGEKLISQNTNRRMFLNGNEAISAGAIKAGCKFIAAYPMTPASSILHFLAAKENDYTIVVKHAEDEIAAMNMAIGANFAGVRAMTATSGGGFCLMTEALGLAAQSETPLVVVLAQRPGPSTGQPTHTSQTELEFALHSSQGEFPRVIIAPGDAQECFFETFNAFNLAERFQVPVIILTDKYLAESYSAQEVFDDKSLRIDRGKLLNQEQLNAAGIYKRYAESSDGVSARALPGMMNGLHVATSYEHDEFGYYLEDLDGVQRMSDKRFAKNQVMANIVPQPRLYGPAKAELTFVAWGSSKNPCLEAMRMLEQDGIPVNFLHYVYLWPFPAQATETMLKNVKKTLIVEGNKTGQLMRLIRTETGIVINESLLVYNGQPIYPIDIYQKVKKALA